MRSAEILVVPGFGYGLLTDIYFSGSCLLCLGASCFLYTQCDNKLMAQTLNPLHFLFQRFVWDLVYMHMANGAGSLKQDTSPTIGTRPIGPRAQGCHGGKNFILSRGRGIGHGCWSRTFARIVSCRSACLMYLGRTIAAIACTAVALEKLIH